MITYAQARVAQNSLADVFDSNGEAVTVVDILPIAQWKAEIEYRNGDRKWSNPSDLEPSEALLALMK